MYESTLVDNTFDRIPLNLDLGKNFIASREIPAGRRFIDILFVGLHEKFDHQHNAIPKISSLNSQELSILSFFIDGKRKSRFKISRYFNLDWNTIEHDYLSLFKKKDLIHQIGEKTFQLTNCQEIIPEKVISIEAKINDWKTVLNQAKYNTEYTAESYILIPESSASQISYSKSNLDKRKIGLLTADNCFNVRIKHKPRYGPNTNSHILNFMKLSIVKNYFNNPGRWKTNIRDK